jgi:DNA-binding MarR family transcriptional regulator
MSDRRAAAENVERRDLAATMAPLWRSLLAMERSVAANHALTMWAYATMHQLAGEPVRSQSVLAAGLGLDKTRVIPVLDDLQERRLIRRQPDPADRRVRLLSLTPKGRELFARVQREIHQHEDRLLDQLDAAERAAFISALRTLSRAAHRPS